MGCSHISRPTFTAHTDLNLVFLRSFHQGLSSKMSLNRKEVFTLERSAGNWGPVCSIVGSRSCKRHREGAGAWLRSRHAVLSLNWIAYSSCWSLWSRSSFTAYIHICSPGSPVLGSTSSNSFLFQPPPQFLNCSMPGWLRSRGSSYFSTTSTSVPLGFGSEGHLIFFSQFMLATDL